MINPEELEGREFIYESEYGGHIRLRCTNVSFCTEMLCDADTRRHLTWMVGRMKGNVTDTVMAPEPPESKDRWIARRIRWRLHTEQGNWYELERCYILDEPEQN
jgi:hypothetical protein